MNSASIRVFKPNVTQDEAVRAFRSGRLTEAYWRLRCGPLRRIADVYVPFWLYRVRYQMNSTLNTQIFALDAVHGALDLFEFPHPPREDELLNVDTRNRMPTRLDAGAAQELLRTKVLRLLFSQGFFKLRSVGLEIERLPLELNMPYWLAFYGQSESAAIRVLDAVRRRFEGAKAAAFFKEWLAA
jgi:hypothetical protein